MAEQRNRIRIELVDILQIEFELKYEIVTISIKVVAFGGFNGPPVIRVHLNPIHRTPSPFGVRGIHQIGIGEKDHSCLALFTEEAV